MLATAMILQSPMIGSGPIWTETSRPFVEGCEKNWWTNLLFVSNFVSPGNSCVPHGWYLSCDMQFYILSPLLILAFYKRPKLGKTLVLLGVLFSMLIVGFLTYVYDQLPVPLFSIPDNEDINEYLETIAYKPYTHLGPYLIGMSIGYLFYKKPKLNFGIATQLMGWSLAITSGLGLIFGTLEWNKGHLPSPTVSVLYASFSRVFWTSGIAWITVMCSSGYGGVVNKVLSWPGFIPLSRLSLLTYLIHPIMMYTYASFLQTPFHFSQYLALYLYFGHLCVSFGLAFCYSFFFDLPFTSLEKVFAAQIFKKQFKVPTEKQIETPAFVVQEKPYNTIVERC